ncbi:MAG TPA: DNA gyrase modulator, partial [Legionellaceae bacterium]|nr:DNA gyrase modulator [Legionellaceae bacterium]
MKTFSQNTSSVPLKSTTQLHDLMDDVLQRAKKIGATNASVGVSLDEGFSVDVRLGAVETVAFSEDSSVGITVYIGHAKGSASSSDTSPEALDRMVSAAYEIAKVSASDPCFGLPDPEPQYDLNKDLDLYHAWHIEPAQAIEQAIACEQHARSLDPRIVNSDGMNISTYEFCVGHADTQGFMGMIHSTRHSASCSVVAKASDNAVMQRDYEYTIARHPGDMMAMNILAEKAVSRTVERLGAKKIKTQKIPVLFSSRLSSSLMSSFINAISGYNLYR